MSNKVIIVGGVAGGASAAARLRRLDENCEIIIFERGEHISFANCGLPYYIGGVIENRESLLVQTPESMEERFNLSVRCREEVVEIDRMQRKVKVKDYNTDEVYYEGYDYLILSPGADPVIPSLKGIEADNVFTLRNIPDTDQVKAFIDENNPERAVVVGGGFIGLEMAENLKEQGIEVHLVEMLEQVMSPVDYEMAAMIHNHLRDKGIKLHLGDGMAEISHNNNKSRVVLQSGTEIKTDMVMMSIGVSPNTALAEEAGLKLGETGAIKVNKYLQTNDERIYAIGDAIEVNNIVTEKPVNLPLAGPANKQGRIVANNITGSPQEFNGVQGTSIAKVFDLIIGTTGCNEKQLKKADIEYKVSYTNSKDHAGYYPGAKPMTIKLIFSPREGKIFGAQIVGYKGVDKRIDVLATAVSQELNVFDLQDLELAYAPPFGSAKDPVNMAGFTAGNILNGLMDIIHWQEVDDITEETIIIDVREKPEVMLGKIDGAINIPLNELRDKIGDLDKGKEIIIYCAVGLRGYIASRILKQQGFKKVKNLSGGYDLYRAVKNDQEGLITNQKEKRIRSVSTPEESKEITYNHEQGKKIKLDACGLQCPGPIMKVYNKISEIDEDDILEVKATDPGFKKDIEAWCDTTGNILLDITESNDEIRVMIQKGDKGNPVIENNSSNNNQDKTMVVFSGELDRAIASFIIANGAAAMGSQVTLFFTFWGLNILRKKDSVDTDKTAREKMFSKMMPKGSKDLPLSQMNMFGLGPKMIRKIMKDKNVDSLEALIGQAKLNGVRLVACQMSMDLMGIRKEELIDGVEVGGVATFLNAADNSNMNLFI